MGTGRVLDEEYIYDARAYFDPERLRETMEYRRRFRGSMNNRISRPASEFSMPWNNPQLPRPNFKLPANKMPVPARGAFLGGRFLRSGRFLQRRYVTPWDVCENDDQSIKSYEHRRMHKTTHTFGLNACAAVNILNRKRNHFVSKEVPVGSLSEINKSFEVNPKCHPYQAFSGDVFTNVSPDIESFENIKQMPKRKLAGPYPQQVDKADSDDKFNHGNNFSGLCSDIVNCPSKERWHAMSNSRKKRGYNSIPNQSQDVNCDSSRNCLDHESPKNEFIHKHPQERYDSDCKNDKDQIQKGIKRHSDLDVSTSLKKSKFTNLNVGHFLAEHGNSLEKAIKLTSKVMWGFGNVEKFSEIKYHSKWYMQTTSAEEKIKVFFKRRIKRRCSEAIYYTGDEIEGNTNSRCKDDSFLDHLRLNNNDKYECLKGYSIINVIPQFGTSSNHTTKCNIFANNSEPSFERSNSNGSIISPHHNVTTAEYQTYDTSDADLSSFPHYVIKERSHIKISNSYIYQKLSPERCVYHKNDQSLTSSSKANKTSGHLSNYKNLQIRIKNKHEEHQMPENYIKDNQHDDGNFPEISRFRETHSSDVTSRKSESFVECFKHSIYGSENRHENAMNRDNKFIEISKSRKSKKDFIRSDSSGRTKKFKEASSGFIDVHGRGRNRYCDVEESQMLRVARDNDVRRWNKCSDYTVKDEDFNNSSGSLKESKLSHNYKKSFTEMQVHRGSRNNNSDNIGSNLSFRNREMEDEMRRYSKNSNRYKRSIQLSECKITAKKQVHKFSSKTSMIESKDILSGPKDKSNSCGSTNRESLKALQSTVSIVKRDSRTASQNCSRAVRDLYSRHLDSKQPIQFKNVKR